MLILLIKSTPQFKHTGKYALYGNPPRWHLLHASKTLPKNVPIASSPGAAGPHMPAVLTSDEVAQMKYPAEKAAANHEMAAFNEKHIPELLGHAANGDATAILGMGYGTNSHAKKKVAIANYLLGKMGSAHTVSHGQTSGSHAAVQAAEQIEAGEPAPVVQPDPVPVPAPAPVEPVAVAKPATDSIGAVSAAATSGKLCLHVIKTPNGKFIYAGSVPDVIGFEPGSTPEKILQGKQFGEKFGAKKMVFATAEEAVEYAKQHGFDAVAPVPAAPPAADQVPAAAPAPASKKADGKAQAVAGGQTGMNGYHYKGGQFLPNTMAEPGKWKVGKKWITGKKELIEPGVYANSPTPFSRSVFMLAGVGYFTKLGNDGKLSVNHGVYDYGGNPVTAQMVVTPGVAGVLGSESITLQDLIDGYNSGMRWFDVQPIEPTITSSDGPKDGTVDPGTYDHNGVKKTIAVKKDESGTLSESATGWLHAYQWGVDAPADEVKNTVPSDAVLKELASYVGKSPVKLYRAAYIGADDTGKMVESWSRFHQHAADLVESNHALGKAMKVISRVVDPSEIIVDTTLLPKKFHDANDSGTQAEVVLAIGSFKDHMVAVRSSSADAGPKDGDTKPGFNGSQLVFKNGRWHKVVATDEHGELPPALVPVDDQPAGSGLAMPKFDGGKVGQSVVDYYEKVAKKIIDHAEAGNVSVLEDMKSAGLNPNKYGKIGNTWNGKTPNSKLILALYDQAMQYAAGGKPAESAKDAAIAAAVEHLKEDATQADLPADEKKEDAALVQQLEDAQGAAHTVDLADIMTGTARSKLSPDVFQKDSSVWLSMSNAFDIEFYGTPTFDGDKPSPEAQQALAEYKAAHAAGYSLKYFQTHGLQYPKPYANLLVKDGKVLTKEGAAAMVAGGAAAPADPPVPAPDPKPKAKGGNLSGKFWLSDSGPVKYQALSKTFGVFTEDGKKALGINGKPMSWGAMYIVNDLAPVADKLFANGSHEWVDVYDTLEEATAAHKAAAAPAAKAPRLIIPAAVQTQSAAAPAASKVSQIPWDSLALPDTNSNAASINKKLAALKQAAYAGDAAAIEAMQFGKNTYNKKLALVAQTALAALKEDASAPPPVPEPVAAPAPDPVAAAAPADAPAPATLAGKPAYDHIAQAKKAGQGSIYAIQVAADEWLAANPGKEDELSSSLVDQNMFVIAKKMGIYKPPGFGIVDPPGPQEGDTKQGADGMLVLKNGHWVKVDPDPPAAPAVHPVDAVPLPDMSGWQPHVAVKVASGIDALKKQIKAGNLDPLKGSTKYLHSTGKYYVTLPNPNGYQWMKFNGSTAGKALYDYVNKLKSAAAGAAPAKPKAAPSAPKAAPAKTQATPAGSNVAPSGPNAEPISTLIAGVTNIDKWPQTGSQLGSNSGGRFKDVSGKEWYCKFPGNQDVVKNELLAAKFYQMLGLGVPKVKMVEKDGKLGIASQWIDGMSKAPASDLAKAKGTLNGFVADAWLANWDVVGLAFDNLMIGPDGKAVRVDVGGSLLYRAQGGEKGDQFSDTVPELLTLLDPVKNGNSASVFSGVTQADMRAGAHQLAKMHPNQIIKMCQTFGPGDSQQQMALANKLIARRKFLIDTLGVKDPWIKASPDITKLTVDPSSLPSPVDFENYNGSGKGLSSVAFINKQNTADDLALIEFAKHGNLQALLDYHYDAYDKATGDFIGKKPIAEHPAKIVKGHWCDLCDVLTAIANPPVEGLSMPPIDGGSVEDVSEAAGYFKPGENISTISKEKILGFWMKLGHVGAEAVQDLIPPETKFFKKSMVATAKSWYKSCKEATKALVNAIQDSGSNNRFWNEGKEIVKVDSHGHSYDGPAQNLASQIYADASEMDEGMTVGRWMNMPKSMMDNLLKEGAGLVFQNADSMCTSVFKNWGDNAKFGSGAYVNIRAAKGAKAMLSLGSGRFNGGKENADGTLSYDGGEMEVTTLMGQRFVVLGVKQGNSSSSSGISLDLLMLPPHHGFVSDTAQMAAMGKSMLSSMV